MKTIQYKASYCSLRLRRISWIGIFIMIGLILSTVSWLIVNHLGNQLHIATRIGLLLVAYAGLGVFHIYTQQKYIDTFRNNFVGQRGENHIETILKSNFDDSYTYLRNYVVPKSYIGDIDGLLISTKEIIIIEVKSYSGEFEIINGTFHKFSKNGFLYFCWYNPIKQAEKQKRYLVEYLKQKGMDIHVRNIVVLEHGEVRKINGPTGTYVLNRNNFIDFIKKEESRIHNQNSHSIDAILSCLSAGNK